VNYTFIDVETANRKNDAICAIGIVETDGTKVIDTFYSLINPEEYFDDKNIEIHGITPQLVASKPTITEAWPQMKPYFEGHIICGHNVLFDIRVLEKHLASHNIVLPRVQYICTMKIAKRIGCFDSVKLSDLCQKLNISLVNHNAFSDALASFELLKYFSEKFQYEIYPERCTPLTEHQRFSGINFYSEKTVKMREYKKFVEGILADGFLDMAEIIRLREYTNILIQSVDNNYYLTKIYSLIYQICEDGEITKYEAEDLYNLLAEFLNPISVNEIKADAITFNGKIFCLSGNFESGSKDEIRQIILDKGGICKDSIVKKTDYLVVGELGNASWKMGNFGTKVEKALAMQDSGSKIQIIGEKEFINATKSK